ncbi:hypothetical protein, partial [Duodenibacillus massiliensis]|uniref:hypothetical protein n=1 Tax=Duodenibacillus massiliensis TaxID=1852381 RepID=UPI003AF89B22
AALFSLPVFRACVGPCFFFVLRQSIGLCSGGGRTMPVVCGITQCRLFFLNGKRKNPSGILPKGFSGAGGRT